MRPATAAGGLHQLAELLASVDWWTYARRLLHREPVLAAAAAGKDIVCREALARSLRDAQAIVKRLSAGRACACS